MTSIGQSDSLTVKKWCQSSWPNTSRKCFMQASTWMWSERVADLTSRIHMKTLLAMMALALLRLRSSIWLAQISQLVRGRGMCRWMTRQLNCQKNRNKRTWLTHLETTMSNQFPKAPSNNLPSLKMSHSKPCTTSTSLLKRRTSGTQPDCLRWSWVNAS